MKISIVIIEDQQTDVLILKNMISLWNEEKRFDLSFSVYRSGTDFYRKYSPETDITDVYFLDVRLKDMLGTDIAKDLRKHGYRGTVIFLSAFREFVFQGYEVHALNYLLKPLEQKTLFFCLDEIEESLEEKYYVFSNKQEKIKIDYQSILAFSSYLHYVDIMTEKETYSQYTTLNELEALLPGRFVRIHRSHIVNMEHISKLTKSNVILSNHTTMPIGRSYAKALSDQFMNYTMRFDR